MDGGPQASTVQEISAKGISLDFQVSLALKHPYIPTGKEEKHWQAGTQYGAISTPKALSSVGGSGQGWEEGGGI